MIMIDWIRPSRQWLLSSALSGPDVRGLARIAPGLSNGRPDSGLALCSTHYERIWQWRRAGKPQLASLDARMGRLCSTDNDAAWLSAERAGTSLGGLRCRHPAGGPMPGGWHLRFTLSGDHVHGRLNLSFEPFGTLTLKNIARPA